MISVKYKVTLRFGLRPNYPLRLRLSSRPTTRDHEYINCSQLNIRKHCLVDRYKWPCAMGPLSCLSVTLVYYGQTVGWIKIPFDTEAGLSPEDIVLDGDSTPPREGAQQPPPTFWPMFVAKRFAHLSNCWALVQWKLDSVLCSMLVHERYRHEHGV